MSEDSKFEYSTDYQYELLKFTLKDKDGYKALELYDQSYFTLDEHAVIADALKRFYSKYKRIPKEPSILKEEISNLFRSRDYIELFTSRDRSDILDNINKLYKSECKDGDLILDKCVEFAKYVELKHVVENVNLLNVSEYDTFSSKIQKAIKHGDSITEDYGTMLIGNIKERQFDRQDKKTVLPTPFQQINDATNAGGYDKGSVIVVLDRPKKFKTGMVINIARGYLKMKKKVLIIDLENGQDSYATRLEQSIAKRNKKEILSGKFDDKVQRILRKYKRLGGEIVIKRLPALTTTSMDIQFLFDHYYREHGMRFDILIVDYAGLMASTTQKVDDHSRIADAYLDLSNLAIKNGIEHVWSPHHVTKEAYSREKVKYRDSDLAKSTEIGRHVQAIWGLNRDEDEEENNIMRMELVTQRDGKQTARALFHVDYPTQRADEFNKSEIREYNSYTDLDVEEDEVQVSKRSSDL